MWTLFLLIKGYFFSFLHQCSRITFFYSPGYDILGSQFLATKIRITQRKPNQNRKYFNPLVSGPGWFVDPDTMEKVLIRIQEKKVGEKTGGRKFRGTVPKYCSSILPRIEYKDTAIVY